MTFRRTRCPQCKGKLEAGQRIHPACIDAYAESEAAKAQRKADKQARALAKLDRALVRERKAAMKRIPELTATAQDAFNAFIRERDKDKGCFVCGRPFEPVQGKRQHAGHVRSRGAAGHLRFTEDNCMGECEGCNGPRGAKPHQIKAGAIARIGQARFDELEADNTPKKWTRDELIAITKEYRAKLRELKRQEA